ncbi:acetate--CoA ligase family protein [Bradyrhizobium mercantei]|uniref:acetate--CoA ligase family protein n=1 Tax=Bradyrhizobium mercantei TaxID=1904807 RepID=UPI0009759459|nr:acetate--CoA ligase family protein [Bradyrhizobium mercantei]
MLHDRLTKGHTPDDRADVALDLAWNAGQSACDEYQAKALLRRIGIPTPKGIRLSASQSAKGALGGLESPFALKALSDNPIHKSDIGAICLSLPSEEAVDDARAEIAARMADAGQTLSGFLVEEMADSGLELIIGGIHDPKLGPMIMIGAGGIFTEVLNDTIFGLCPISSFDAIEMIESLKILPILKGARGRAPVDLTALESALLALGGETGLFWQRADRIAEFDINPVIVNAKGVTAVDARFVLKAST